MKVMFNYGTRMKTRDLKRNASMFGGVATKGVNHGIKDLVKACATGNAPISMKPYEPATNKTEKQKGVYG